MNEIGYSAIVLLVPLVGTTLGAAMCFVLKRDMPTWLRKVLLGFASGVMVAASIWSLLDPSIEQSSEMGVWAFVPAAVGLAIGFAFLLLIDTLTPHLHTNKVDAEGLPSKASRTSMMLAAVTIHNIPEGMTTGVVLAAALASLANGTGLHEAMIPALTLAIGMAIQNFPEGAIVSMPLRAEGNGKFKSFLLGSFSGAVEPLAGLLAVGFLAIVVPALPYLLSFAAGAMLYVVIEELIPEAMEGKHTNVATIGFAVGFILMMILDVALG